MRQPPEVRFVVRFVDNLRVPQIRMTAHRLLDDPLIFRQNPLVGPVAYPLGRRPARHVAVPEAFRRDVVRPAPGERRVHPRIIDALGDRLLVAPCVPITSGIVKPVADASFVRRPKTIVARDHATEEKVLARLRQSGNAIASTRQRDLFAGVQTGGERGIGGCGVPHRLPGILKMIFGLPIDRGPFATGKRLHFAHSAQSGGSRIDDEFDVPRLRVPLAVVIRPAMHIAEAGNLES